MKEIIFFIGFQQKNNNRTQGKIMATRIINLIRIPDNYRGWQKVIW